MLRTLARVVLALLLLALPLRATWSILIVDLATGEVAVGIATCLTGFDLRPNTIVVIPGIGVAAAQSFVGPLSLRELIRAQLLLGTPPAQILAMLQAADPGHQTRQYGIADTRGGAVTFTGTGAGIWAGGLTGQIGSLVYTVQGNVLTGQPVIQAAEQAIRNTTGDMASKLMAAMQAAASMGGDGRCSCNASAPTSCGSPPPSFTKSAHIGLMVVSRPGDIDNPCNANFGCGAGNYWLDLNVANQPATAPDPIAQLQTLFNTWRTQQQGRPDHFLSTVTLSGQTLRANGHDLLTGAVVLRDAQGNPLGNTANVTIALNPTSTATNAVFSPVVREPNGSYSFTMRDHLGPGRAVLDVFADDGRGPVRISPQPVIQIGDPFGPCGQGAVSNGQGGFLDALQIGGSGGQARIFRVGFSQPFVLTLSPPVGAPTTLPVGLFALWAHLGTPRGNNPFPLGPGSGSLCFTPFPLDPLTPTLLLADSFGLGSFFPSGPAPWVLGFPGVAAVLDVAVQGLLIRDLQSNLAATNAVMLRVVPSPVPVITSISPTFTAGGNPVTITGANFVFGVEVRVGTTPAVITNRTPTAITFTMPGGIGCDSTLAVTNPGGTPVTTPINASPVITSTPFAAGPAAGGALYLVSGRNLLGAVVTFNGNPMTVTSQSATAILGNTPPGIVGPAQVLVRNNIGCQAGTTYTYQ